MKTLRFTDYGGADWHDSSETNRYFKVNDSYDIKDPEVEIAKHARQYMLNMAEGTGNEEPVRLLDVPDEAAFIDAVKNKKEIFVTSKRDPEYPDVYLMSCELLWDKKYNCYGLDSTYMCGQVTHTGTYIIDDIPDEKVRYIAVENFLAPQKGVPTVQRFYDYPKATLEEALADLEKIPGSCERDPRLKSQKEIHIVDIDKIQEDDWYKDNVAKFGQPWTLYAKEVEINDSELTADDLPDIDFDGNIVWDGE